MQLPLEPLNQKLVVIGTVSPICFFTSYESCAREGEMQVGSRGSCCNYRFECVCPRRALSSSRAAAWKISGRGSRASALVSALKPVLITKRSAAWALVTELP